MNKRLYRENITIAVQSIKSNLLRTILTVLIIAIGITALVGILTSIDAIKSSINSNFTNMGANTFSIRNKEMTVRIGRQGKKPKVYRNISFDEAMAFKDKFTFPALTSVSTMASGSATIRFESKKTNPNIIVNGADENYLACTGYAIELGRNFSPQEINRSSNVVIIGYEIKTKLFGKKSSAINQFISVGPYKYRVIGVLKEKGSAMGGMGGDKLVIIPLKNARQYFGSEKMNYIISILCNNPAQMEVAIGEATGLFNKIRHVKLGQEENFEIMKSDSLVNILIDNISFVTLAATIIGFITLLGAAIGLMNIMLVSVAERTREIGVRKSLGATQSIIKNQFLIEAVVICQLGGLLGIVLGIIIGNIISAAIGVGFIVPWFWMMSGILICIAVGLIAGIYPAVKASKLDPIEALRVE